MPPQALAAVATILSFAPHGNHIELQLDRGSAELVWVTASTFRFRRAMDGPLPAVEWREREGVRVEIDDLPGRINMRSKYLDVSIQKRGLLVRVRRADGTPLANDLSEPRASEGTITWERQAPANTRYYGLGPRTDAEFDLRGKAQRTEFPTLVTTAGYGEYHARSGTYRFDFTARDRYRVEAPGIDYFFYYGPTVKQIFEEHKGVRGDPEPWSSAAGTDGSWNTLRNTLLRLVHGSMSAMLTPTLSLRQYEGAPAEVVQRARQIGSLVDDVSPGPVGLSGFRKQLESFFATYSAELHTRGFPIWHPLPFQFPDDAECARFTDEFMLGDEMLVAPVYEPGGKRQVYLPRGVWTNLDTNEVFTGRRTIAVETASLPVFARNGTIIPLDSAAGMALHYFPKLGAEFFLLETDPGDWSQVHAAPAGDVVRLEIESKKTRDYEWVVHHVERPTQVSFENIVYREAPSAAAMANQTWFYDAAKRNLMVRTRVAAGEDCIIYLGLQLDVAANEAAPTIVADAAR